MFGVINSNGRTTTFGRPPPNMNIRNQAPNNIDIQPQQPNSGNPPAQNIHITQSITHIVGLTSEGTRVNFRHMQNGSLIDDATDVSMDIMNSFYFQLTLLQGWEIA